MPELPELRDLPDLRDPLADRIAPLALSADEFRALGHDLIDHIADALATIGERPLTPGEPRSVVRRVLGEDTLPQHGTPPAEVLDAARELLFTHSLWNGHPRFWGYVIGSPSPLGMLGDLLAAAVNPNCGGWSLSPMAAEMERQAVGWIGELLGFPPGADGILVSGGNMANMVCFLAARTARASWDVRTRGLAAPEGKRLRVYTSEETHTWLDKSVDLFGLGEECVRRIPTDERLRLRPDRLAAQIDADRAAGDEPWLVVASAGTVSTGAVDPLRAIAAVCRARNIWLHVDGAYGGFAAALPEALLAGDGADVAADLKAITLADSVAIDPHKWLYVPFEAGCAIVREHGLLRRAFSHVPPYYNFVGEGADEPLNFYERGPQNSRGFRALKVWIALRAAGREGYEQMIGDDVRLSRALFANIAAHPEFEAVTQGLSITTFRYVPPAWRGSVDAHHDALNTLNRELSTRLQAGGELFVSNAVLADRYLLRACFTNFRTTRADVDAAPEMIARVGREVVRELVDSRGR